MNLFQISYRVTLVTLSTAAVSFFCVAQPLSPSLAMINSPSLPVSRLSEPAWRSRWEAKQKILARTGAIDCASLPSKIGIQMQMQVTFWPVLQERLHNLGKA